MRHVLVEEDALDQGSVLERAADLAGHLDQVKRDVLALKVRNRQNCVDRDLGEQAVRLGHAAQVGGGGEV